MNNEVFNSIYKRDSKAALTEIKINIPFCNKDILRMVVKSIISTTLNVPLIFVMSLNFWVTQSNGSVLWENIPNSSFFFNTLINIPFIDVAEELTNSNNTQILEMCRFKPMSTPWYGLKALAGCRYNI